MEVARIFDLRQFDRTSKRFRDLVLKNSSKPDETTSTPDGRGGISVFETTCACLGVADQNPDCLCEHIAKFYPAVAGDPCAFWIFDMEAVQAFVTVPVGGQVPLAYQKQSASGDDCHHNIHHLSDGQANKVRKKLITEASLRLCVNGRCEPFTSERATALVDAHFQ